MPKDKDWPLTRHSRGVYDTDDIVILTRQPDPNPPRMNILVNLSPALLQELKYPFAALLFLGYFISILREDVGFTESISFLMLMLVQSMDMRDLARGSFAIKTILMTWSVALLFVGSELTSQLLSVLQKPEITHKIGTKILNETIELEEVVQKQRLESREERMVPNVICFADDVSPILIGNGGPRLQLGHTFVTPRGYEPKTRAIVQSFHDQVYLQLLDAFVEMGKKARRKSDASFFKNSVTNFLIAQWCGSRDPENMIRPGLRPRVKADPTECVKKWAEEWPARAVYPFGLRKIIEAELGNMSLKNLSQFMQHRFSKSILKTNIYPISDSSSPYTVWFDKFFTKLAEIGVFGHSSRESYLTDYRVQKNLLERDDWRKFNASIHLFSAEKMAKRCDYLTLKLLDNPVLFIYPLGLFLIPFLVIVGEVILSNVMEVDGVRTYLENLKRDSNL